MLGAVGFDLSPLIHAVSSGAGKVAAAARGGGCRLSDIRCRAVADALGSGPVSAAATSRALS